LLLLHSLLPEFYWLTFFFYLDNEETGRV